MFHCVIIIIYFYYLVLCSINPFNADGLQKAISQMKESPNRFLYTFWGLQLNIKNMIFLKYFLCPHLFFVLNGD